MEREDSIKPTAMTKTQLAQLYGVDKRTFDRWLKPFKNQIGEKMGHIYTPKQVSIIYECLGTP